MMMKGTKIEEGSSALARARQLETEIPTDRAVPAFVRRRSLCMCWCVREVNWGINTTDELKYERK